MFAQRLERLLIKIDFIHPGFIKNRVHFANNVVSVARVRRDTWFSDMRIGKCLKAFYFQLARYRKLTTMDNIVLYKLYMQKI